MTFLFCEKFGIKYEEGTIAFKGTLNSLAN